jgi:phytanoyl-CoA hydroxylase
MRILYHPHVSETLMRISGQPSFISWQDMLFDRSVGTIDHQDSWYLDTRPHGHLVAGWFALEDIHPSSGPFFVYPGSHLLPRVSETDFPVHEDFLAEIKKMVAGSGLEKKSALLKKGDVLFWHPNLVHGADTVQDERYSRKSLTSHYYPVGYLRKDSKTLADDLQMIKRTDNPVIFRKGIPELSYVFKGHVKFFKDRLLNDRLPIANMNRDAYDI